MATSVENPPKAIRRQSKGIFFRVHLVAGESRVGHDLLVHAVAMRAGFVKDPGEDNRIAFPGAGGCGERCQALGVRVFEHALAVVEGAVVAPDLGRESVRRVSVLVEPPAGNMPSSHTLLTLKPSPVVGLNRALAVANVHGPAAMAALPQRERLERHYLLHALEGELQGRPRNAVAAAESFRRALRLAQVGPE
jgi:hypothetical protein